MKTKELNPLPDGEVSLPEPNTDRAKRKMFEADFAKSRIMNAGEYDRKPWYFRFGVRLARLTSPVQ